MTKFDEARAHPDGWRWVRPIGRQPAVFVVSIVAIGLLVCVAAAFLCAAQAARVQAARQVAGTQLAVVLGSQVTRSEAESMRSSLESISLVASARLQTREQALTRLVGSSDHFAGSRSNPLPDLWILTIREPQTDAAMRTFAEDRARLGQTLAGMPGVASVRMDHEWIEFVDRCLGIALRMLPVVQGATLGALALLVGCIAFLAGRIFGVDAGGAGSAVTVGALTGFFGLAIAAASGAAIGNIAGSAAIDWAGLRPMLRASVDSPLVWLGLIVLGVSALGTLVGRYR